MHLSNHLEYLGYFSVSVLFPKEIRNLVKLRKHKLTFQSTRVHGISTSIRSICWILWRAVAISWCVGYIKISFRNGLSVERVSSYKRSRKLYVYIFDQGASTLSEIECESKNFLLSFPVPNTNGKLNPPGGHLETTSISRSFSLSKMSP